MSNPDPSRIAFEAWLDDPHEAYSERDCNLMFGAWQASRKAALLDAMNATLAFGNTGRVIAKVIGGLK